MPTSVELCGGRLWPCMCQEGHCAQPRSNGRKRRKSVPNVLGPCPSLGIVPRGPYLPALGNFEACQFTWSCVEGGCGPASTKRGVAHTHFVIFLSSGEPELQAEATRQEGPRREDKPRDQASKTSETDEDLGQGLGGKWEVRGRGGKGKMKVAKGSNLRPMRWSTSNGAPRPTHTPQGRHPPALLPSTQGGGLTNRARTAGGSRSRPQWHSRKRNRGRRQEAHSPRKGGKGADVQLTCRRGVKGEESGYKRRQEASAERGVAGRFGRMPMSYVEGSCGPLCAERGIAHKPVATAGSALRQSQMCLGFALPSAPFHGDLACLCCAVRMRANFHGAVWRAVVALHVPRAALRKTPLQRPEAP
jgi:hypothetical protein